MGTFPIERGGDVGRITLQEGGVRGNPTQADDPGAGHSGGDEPHYNPDFPLPEQAVPNVAPDHLHAPSSGKKGAGFPLDGEGILTPFDT